MGSSVNLHKRTIPLICALALLFGSGCSLSAVSTLATPVVEQPERPASSFIDARDQVVEQPAVAESVSAASGVQPVVVVQQPIVVQQPVVVQRPIYHISPTCYPRQDWSVYIVQAGDTLARIAARYGTTAETLAYANCIANPNLIYAGQALRVPYTIQPPIYPPHRPPPIYPPYPPPTYPPPTYPPTPPPTAIPPVVVGSSLSISSYAALNGTVYTLNPDELITITWNGFFPTATRQVAFELILPLGGNQVIGIDSNPVDGAAIQWRAVPGTQGTLRAIASFNGGYLPQNSDAYYVIVP
ncbi:MAG: LysM peptidoglycan-binding domain-containing protein [Chloroflexi bacterium]|nr:LysM peptidoglycan-binding domain-containing protein [Chloroflexota bacterium]